MFRRNEMIINSKIESDPKKGQKVRKRTFGQVRPATIQISLRIHAV